MSLWHKLGLGLSLCLAAAAGLFAAIALGAGTAAPTKTTTITIPAAGGAADCPEGSTFQAVVINTPGGQTTLWVCVAG